MPDKNESLFDKFRRAQRFGKDKPDTTKRLQDFAKSEAERRKKKPVVPEKDSRWFKNIKPDVYLPASGKKK